MKTRDFVKPMLATLVDKPFDRSGWLFEVKWDGYRAIAEIKNGSVNLYSRNGISFNKTYPPIVKALASMKKSAVLDGEIIALKGGIPDFHALQNYREGRAPLQYAVFDIIRYDGKNLQNTPLIERKKILKKILVKNDLILYGDFVRERGMDFFTAVGKKGLEGIVAKNEQSSYRPGHRGTEWLKMKHQKEQEAIIVGFTEPRGSRKEFGSLVLGAYENEELVYIGHSGGGFSEKELEDIRRRIWKFKVEKPPFRKKIQVKAPTTWVRPKLVCRVKFTGWTPDGRMRHPIFAGLREDKKPKEVRKEAVKKAEIIAQKTEEKIHGKKEDKEMTGLKFSNLEKIFWPREKYTKGHVIDYYERIADTILPYLKDRPESLNRHPNGINGQSFFQKNITSKVPEFVETRPLWSESNNKEIRFLLCQNKETLLYMANLGCIELNPWNSRIETPDNPDYMIIDLDPDGNSWKEVAEVALVVHDVLKDACEEHYPKTSGKRGLHIIIPLGAKYSYTEIREFLKLLALAVHRRIPELTSVERDPGKRKKKIYVDYLQNRRGQTIAAPYSLRPWPGATVSAPVTWNEIKGGIEPAAFTIETMPNRIKKIGDIYKPVIMNKIDLGESIQCLIESLEGDKKKTVY